jgi:hypothetical protein
MIGASTVGRGWVIGVLLAVAALSPTAASGAPPSAPPGFKLKASNGYVLSVYGTPGYGDQPAQALILIGRPGAAVIYSTTDATVTESSIEAGFAGVGSVDMEFHGTGRVRRQKSVCGQKPVRFRGYYSGTFEFHGEEGYSAVDATRAPADLQFFLDVVCASGSGESRGPGLPGAALLASTRSRRPRARLQVNQNRPGARVTLAASTEERQGDLYVARFVEGSQPASVFAFEPDLSTATLKPRLPFSGSAVFHRGAPPANRWRGDLSVDLPGLSDVSLAAARMRTNLVHAALTKEGHAGG